MTETKTLPRTDQQLYTLIAAFITYCAKKQKVREFPHPILDIEAWHTFCTVVHAERRRIGITFDVLKVYEPGMGHNVYPDMRIVVDRIAEFGNTVKDTRWVFGLDQPFMNLYETEVDLPILAHMFEIALTMSNFLQPPKNL